MSERFADPGDSRRGFPRATYRLQFNSRFTLAQGAEILEYLRHLGISDCYASPLFEAGPQSAHGYDVCGFGRVSASLGGSPAFERFVARLRELGLGLLLDMVPNHMGASPANAWWLDVLERGRASPYASWFDIDWESPNPGLRDKVLLPVLEDYYPAVLESGKLQVLLEDGVFALAYHDRRFPLAPGSYPTLLRAVLAGTRLASVALAKEGSTASPYPHAVEDLVPVGSPNKAGAVAQLERLTETLATPELEPGESTDFARLKAELASLCRESPVIVSAAERALAKLNGRAGEPRSFDGLHALLQQQHYRLAYWRVAREQLNYRRFFDVTELVSLRMELREVFEATHQSVISWLREGKIMGLRIDHPDGLRDPKAYLARLQDAHRPASEHDAPLYVVVEKILTGDETLPPDWPVAGTTGYDFLNRLNALFVNPGNRLAFDSLYREFTGTGAEFEDIVYAAKEEILHKSLLSELDALTRRLEAICAQTRYGQDFTREQLRAALSAVIAGFPVYRTYAQEDATGLDARAREYCQRAIDIASRREPAVEPAVFRFLHSLLQLRVPDDLDDQGRRDCREFLLRFQQLTGPVMAKGVEDTAFYRYHRLVSLNEVGGDPAVFGSDLETFHRYALEQAWLWPHTLLATATHDTKRGEDVRARLNVLSEMPEEWRLAIFRWSGLNAAHKRRVDGETAPDANDEYLLYQILLGAWPGEPASAGALESFRERISAYMLKAVREAKVHTSWTEPNPAYEKATLAFVTQILNSPGSNPFLADLTPFQQHVAFFGRYNSLSQVLLKMAAPGVPDFYQGSELWDLNLVDPDNRRPVDFKVRRLLLADLQSRVPETGAVPAETLDRLFQQTETGQAKLYVIWRVLQFRSRHPELFARGSYLPHLATGSRAEHVCAFTRQTGREQAIAVAPRLVWGLVGGRERAPLGPEIWGDTVLSLPNAAAGEQYRNVLTGDLVSVAPHSVGLPLASILARFPVALLERLDSASPR